MKHIYLVAICYVGTIHCMEMELLTQTTQSQNPLGIQKNIEKTRAAYNNLSFIGQKNCYNKNTAQYSETLDSLSGQKKEAKTNEKRYYIDISQYPITIDNNTGAQTLSINKGNSSDFEPSDYVLLKGFKAMHPNAWKHLTKMSIHGMNLGSLPLHKFVVACPHLTKLNASHNKIEGLSYHGACYNDPSSITDLNLSYNHLPAVDLDELFILCPYIQDLDLSHNNSLHVLKMTRNLPCHATSKRSCGDPILGASLPRIHIYNTALTNETKNNLKQTYINTIINAYAELYGARGCVIGMPIGALLSPLVVLLSFDTHTNLETIIGAGIGHGAGIIGGCYFIGKALGKLRAYSLSNAIKKHAESHIIQEEKTS